MGTVVVDDNVGHRHGRRLGMILCIFGSRDVRDEEATWQAIEDGFAELKLVDTDIISVLGGGAPGADEVGRLWAIDNGFPTHVEDAAWNDLAAPGAVIKNGPYGKYNAMAGFDRNEVMAKEATHFIALRSAGKSSGTDDMIRRVQKYKKPLSIQHL